MNYFDFTDDIIGIDQTNRINSTAMQPFLPPPTTNASTVGNQQQTKDFSDWRNIQVRSTSNGFDPFWLPQTPWTPSNHTIYPSPYNPMPSSSSSAHPYRWTNPNNNNPPWRFPPPLPPPAQSFGNINRPDTMNNTTVNPSNSIRFNRCEYFKIIFCFFLS
jgi:hypothetical protein